MGTSEHYRQGTLLLDYRVCAIGQWGLLTDGKSTLGSTIIMMESWMIMLVVAYSGGGGDGDGDAYGGRGAAQTYGSQVCLRSAIVGTVQVVHPGVP